MTKIAFLRLLRPLFCFLLLTISLAAEAAEQYPKNLEMLSAKLARLENINNQLQADYLIVENKLQISLAELNAAKEQSAKLQTRVQELDIISKRQEYLLENANNSLVTCKKEVEAEVRKHKLQKAGWAVAAILLLLSK